MMRSVTGLVAEAIYERKMKAESIFDERFAKLEGFLSALLERMAFSRSERGRNWLAEDLLSDKDLR